MKILHTADWHLGKRLESFPRLEEQREVLAEICDIADQQEVDAVIIAGDIFDNFHPSAEVTELLYSTLHRLSAHGTRAVIAIAGNHDSPERIQVPDTLARLCGIVFIGFPCAVVQPFSTEGGVELLRSAEGFIELKLPRCDFPLRIIHTPYANELRLRTYFGNDDDSDTLLRDYLQAHWQQVADTYCDVEGFNMLATHLYVMKKGGPAPEEPEDERPIVHIGGAQAIFSENFPKGIQYVALGHLHRYQVVDTTPCPIVYASSPLSYSFSEANQRKFVVLLEAERGKLTDYQPIALKSGKPLLVQRCYSVDEAVAWLTAHPEALVQLTYVSDNFLETSEKRRMTQCHTGIVQLIPEVRQIIGASTETAAPIGHSPVSIEESFSKYFASKQKGQMPSKEIMDLFAEVRGVDISVN